MTDESAGLGHNQPPSEQAEYVARLEGDHEDLLDRQGDLELARGKLPQQVQSDEDVAAITAWVTQMRQLARDAEDRRKDAKAPYETRGRWIDGFFGAGGSPVAGSFRARILEAAKTAEQRSTAYLTAKRAREQAEAQERARAAAREREAKEAAARAAREAEQKAAAARAAAEARLREAAQKSPAESVAAAQELQHAVQQEVEAGAATEQADTAHRQAALKEEREEKRTEDPRRAGKTSGGGGNANVTMVPGYRITSVPQLLQSIGPLHPFVDMKWLEAPLQRWARIAQNRPADRTAIPGVEWFEQPEVKTTAARQPPPGHYTRDR